MTSVKTISANIDIIYTLHRDRVYSGRVLVVLGRVARPPGCLLAELAAEADRERMDLGAAAGGRALGAKLKGNFLLLCCWLTCSLSPVSASAPSGPMIATEGH